MFNTHSFHLGYRRLHSSGVSTLLRHSFDSAYRVFVNPLRFDLYVDHFAKQVRDVLKQMDACFHR